MANTVIAELLCPKRERWNKILDFSVESIRFIGYPVSIGQKSRSIQSFRSTTMSFMSFDSETSTKPKENISAFNVAIAFEVDSKLLLNIDSIKEAIIAISN